MNPLQEHPHLFANGKFSFFADGSEGIIEGYYNNRLIDHVGGEEIKFFDVIDCTLIARPISDISLDEMKKSGIWEGLYDDDLREERIISEEQTNYISVREFMFYLSIGVYPFDQQHFQDGTVININDL